MRVLSKIIISRKEMIQFFRSYNKETNEIQRLNFRESSLQIISFIWPDRNLKAHKVILAIGERHGA
jgi:hypothetical protein